MYAYNQNISIGNQLFFFTGRHMPCISCPPKSRHSRREHYRHDVWWHCLQYEVNTILNQIFVNLPFFFITIICFYYAIYLWNILLKNVPLIYVLQQSSEGWNNKSSKWSKCLPGCPQALLWRSEYFCHICRNSCKLIDCEPIFYH